jgi:uncharacterized protein involved in type VI secretion and phage assembly
MMPDYVIITIDGRKQVDLYLDLSEVQVDTNVFLPAMFSITVKDELDVKTGKFKYADTDTFKVGAEIKIEIETDEIPDEVRTIKATLVIGEITGIDLSLTAEGVPLLQVRGYDRAHRLTEGKKTRTYGDANPRGSGITEEQIINTIVQETDGLTGKQVDTSGLSGVKYSYVMQYNQTDLEFLWSRARSLGYQVYVLDKTLYFQKADAHRGNASDKPGTLTWGYNLGSFEPRLSAIGQVTKGVVKGWDPAQKQAIEGTSTTDSSKTIPAIGLNKKGSAVAKQAFSSRAEDVVVDRPLVTIDQAKAMASALFAGDEGEFIQAEGICRQGDPRLIAGRIVTIEGVGQRFSGDYYVTEARHVYAQGTYRVTFGVTGRMPNTFGYLLNGHNGQDRGLVKGVVTAKVTNLEDPEALGRVQVMFPWLPKYKSADLASNWARVATPMGGKERGFLFIPEVDDEVLVAFEHGDVNFPYIVGVLWNSTDKPPQGTAGILSGDKKKVNQRVLRSRSGHLIILDDTDGEEQIIIRDKTQKNDIVINSKENTMTIKAEGDLTIEAGGKLTLKSKGDMSLQSQAKGNIKTQSDLALEATGNGKLSGAQLALESKGKSELKGTQVAIQAQAQAEISGNAQVSVKSSGMTQIQGSLVKIN